MTSGILEWPLINHSNDTVDAGGGEGKGQTNITTAAAESLRYSSEVEYLPSICFEALGSHLQYQHLGG